MQTKAIFARMDLDGDGKITLVEFKAHLGMPFKDLESNMDPKAVFRTIDTDNDGFIQFGELFADLQKRNMGITEKEVRITLTCLLPWSVIS